MNTITSQALHWHPAATPPDADMTVLLWITEGNEADWAGGWWDGEDWRLCESGGVAAGTVTHWCEPEGPEA